jgi:hypothetical protein
MRPLRFIFAVALSCTAMPAAGAQESLLPSAAWGLAPMFTMWHFDTPVSQSFGRVRDVNQMAAPFRARVVIGGHWNLDASGAFATSSVSIDSSGHTSTLSLAGLTDIKLRLSSAFMDDHLLVTAGVNAPTGTTGLNANQTSVLQVISAPALHMPVSALGAGSGGTLGVVAAREAAGWALAIGGSVEARAEYSAIEVALASGNSSTKVTPGAAFHMTLGADRAIGDARLSLALLGDKYSQDRVAFGSSIATGDTRYTLGTQETALARIDMALGGWREATGSLALRYRGAFTDGSGATVSGSNGSYAEASVGGVRGGPTGPGMIFGADARYHSGFTFSNALVAAANSAAGITVGVELPNPATVLRLALHAEYGHFDTGSATSNGFGLSLIGAIAARRNAQ